MPYNPSIHSTVGKSTGLYGFRTADARSYFYNTATYQYRPYTSKQEVYDYLQPTSLRNGNFPIYIKESGVTLTYWFKDGISDSDLVLFDEVIASGIFDPETSILTLSTNRGKTIPIPIDLTPIKRKEEWSLNGERNGVNTVFTSSVPFQAASTILHVNGVRQQWGDNYIELDYTQGKIQIFTPPEVTDALNLSYYPLI